MHLLALDIGNTTTQAALFVGETIVGTWTDGDDRDASVGELAAAVAAGGALSATEAIALCSVVPSLTERYLDALPAHLSQEAVVVSAANCGLPVLYEPPSAAGADRLANAVAALARLGAPAIAVDFGTTTTFDVVDASGAFVGGAIALGPGAAAEALHTCTAQLPRVEVRAPLHPIGSSTAEAIRSGLVLGHAALIDGMIERIRSELGAAAPVIATGGLAPIIAPLCRTAMEHDSNLTLNGVRLVWAHQVGGKRNRAGCPRSPQPRHSGRAGP